MTITITREPPVQKPPIRTVRVDCAYTNGDHIEFAMRAVGGSMYIEQYRMDDGATMDLRVSSEDAIALAKALLEMAGAVE